MSVCHPRGFLPLCAAVALLAFATTSPADQRNWLNSEGGEFDSAINWSGLTVPGIPDQAVFNLGDVIYAVTFSSNISNNQLTIDQGNVTFDLLGHQYQLSANGADITTAAIRVGAQASDNAYVEVTNGTLTGKMAAIGWVNGSADDLVIWTGGVLNTDTIDVGHFGAGHLTVDSGGTVSSTTSIKVGAVGRISQGTGQILTPTLNIQGGQVESSGILVIDPAGSPFATGGIYVGINGTGNLSLTAGAQLSTSNEAYVGVFGTSIGNVTIDGGSFWTMDSSVVIGNAGKATLNIRNAGSVSVSADARIGSSAGSTGTVTVDGFLGSNRSTFWVSGNLDVATSGTATLTITNKGYGLAGDLTVGRNFGSNGTLIITNQGDASASDVSVGRSLGSNGTLRISGSESEFDCNSLSIGGSSTAPGGIGLVNITNFATVTATGPVTVWPKGTLQASGVPGNPSVLTTMELRLRGGKFSGSGNLWSPISNGGGTIEIPGPDYLGLGETLTSLPNALLQRIGPGRLIIGAQNHAPGATLWLRGGETWLAGNAGTPATSGSPAVANLNVIIGPEPADVSQTPNQVLHSLSVNFLGTGRQSYVLTSLDPGAYPSISVYDTTLKRDLFAAIANANRPGAPDPQDGIYDRTLHPNSAVGIAKLTDDFGDPYLLIRSTRIGDLNLDGTVTISDFIDLASHFNESGPDTTWQEGDLNYDNAVTISDFIDLASNFGLSYSGAATPISPSDRTLLNTFASSHNLPLLPEPSSFLLLATLFPLLARPARTFP